MSAPDRPAKTPNLDWLFALQRFGIKPGLAPMRALLADLGSPQEAYDSVLVAGTNGKGSVARAMATCLLVAGRSAGLYTSPHLQRVGERVEVDGEPTPDALLDEVVGRVRPAAVRHGNTFFEVVTAAALLRFAEAGARVAVLEVGLGGRLDATNVVEPGLSLITSIALDHAGVLGDTLAQIAFEKAGIMRRGVTALSGVVEPEPAAVIARRAADLGAPLRVYGTDFWGVATKVGYDGTEFALHDHALGARDGALARTALVGRHQVGNMTLAVEGALALGVPLDAALAGVAATRWPGRLESFELQGRRVLLDGAHNPAAALALAATVRELEGAAAVLVFGSSADKDVVGVLGALTPVARRLVLTHAANSPRALAPDDLAASAPPGLGPRPLVAEDPAAALRAALGHTRPGDTVLVAGSLFLVGEVRDLLTGAAGEGRPRWQ